jgi:hypothetical protein
LIVLIDFFYRILVRVIKTFYLKVFFRNLPKINIWTEWAEIDNYLGVLSTDPYFKRFRRNKILMDTMDYQRIDAHGSSIRLKNDGILEPKLGRPIKPFSVGNSLNSGHQYRHLLAWMSTTSLNLNSIERIVEFGGGYGCMRWLVSHLAFNGQYSIVDNSGIQQLQKRYLKEVVTDSQLENTNWVNVIEDLKPELEKNNLFIALWSLSETPTEFMKKTLSQLDKSNCHFLIAFQHDFHGRKNIEFFEDVFVSATRSEIKDISGKIHSTYIFR